MNRNGCRKKNTCRLIRGTISKFPKKNEGRKENLQAGWLEFDPGTLNLPISRAANTSRCTLHHNFGFRNLEGKSSKVSRVFLSKIWKASSKTTIAWNLDFYLLLKLYIISSLKTHITCSDVEIICIFPQSLFLRSVPLSDSKGLYSWFCYSRMGCFT